MSYKTVPKSSFAMGGFASFTVAATIALGLALSLALCLEVLKRIIAKVTFKRYFKKSPWLLPFSALLGFIALSVGLSFYASLHIPSKLAALPALEDLSTVQAVFDAQIIEIQKERDLYRTNRLYKNRLASEDAKEIKQFNQEIKALRKQANATMEQVKLSNQTKLSNWEAQNTGLGYILGYISLGLELIFILSMAYQYRYIWDCYLENSPAPEDPNGTKKKQQNGSEESPEEFVQNPTQRQPQNLSNQSLTILDKEETTNSDNPKQTTKIIKIADNETIEEIRRIKDRLSKNWERSFTSKGLKTRQRNLKQAKFWAKHLETQFHIQASLDAENRKVHFQTLKTA